MTAFWVLILRATVKVRSADYVSFRCSCPKGGFYAQSGQPKVAPSSVRADSSLFSMDYDAPVRKCGFEKCQLAGEARENRSVSKLSISFCQKETERLKTIIGRVIRSDNIAFFWCTELAQRIEHAFFISFAARNFA